MNHPVFSLLSPRDLNRVADYLGGELRDPDLTIAPDGTPYIYRWHLIPRNRDGNLYFHIQVASDPERPLHDHPWDNATIMVAGSYIELIDFYPGTSWGSTASLVRREGETIQRDAEAAHRIILPDGVPYAMTLFTTGPHRREWGYWYPDGWHHNKQHVQTRDGVSIHV